MKFYNREHEMAKLKEVREQAYNDHSRLTVVTGRRRIGKTSLIIKAMEGEPFIYLFVGRKNEAALCTGYQIYQIVIAKLPILGDLVGLILSFRSLVTMAILTLFFLLLYIALPNRKSNIFRELPGAIITAGGWLGFSFLFSFYIDHMGNFSYTYGSVAALAICMLWLYFCMYILFIGAEINMVLSHPEVVRATHALLSKKEKSEENSN